MEARIYDYLPKDAVFIRTEVFMKEQKFENEFDELDEKCRHLIVYDTDKPVGNCRFYKENNDSYVIGRIAVLLDYRGLGIGRIIVQKAEEYIKEIGGKEVNVTKLRLI